MSRTSCGTPNTIEKILKKSKKMVGIVGGTLRTSWDFSKPRDVHFGNLTICCFIFHMVSIVQCGRLFQIFSIFFHKYVFFKKNIFWKVVSSCQCMKFLDLYEMCGEP